MRTAILRVRGRDYTVMQAMSLYPTAGSSDDYAYSRHLANSSKPKVFSYTIEWGSPDNETPFHPPYTEMKQIIQEITARSCSSASKPSSPWQKRMILGQTPAHPFSVGQTLIDLPQTDPTCRVANSKLGRFRADSI